jgi:hypothetical protein
VLRRAVNPPAGHAEKRLLGDDLAAAVRLANHRPRPLASSQRLAEGIARDRRIRAAAEHSTDARRGAEDLRPADEKRHRLAGLITHAASVSHRPRQEPTSSRARPDGPWPTTLRRANRRTEFTPRMLVVAGVGVVETPGFEPDGNRPISADNRGVSENGSDNTKRDVTPWATIWVRTMPLCRPPVHPRVSHDGLVGFGPWKQRPARLRRIDNRFPRTCQRYSPHAQE